MLMKFMSMICQDLGKTRLFSVNFGLTERFDNQGSLD